MKSGLTVTTDNADSVLAALAKLSGMDVLVGIPEATPRARMAQLNNAEMGYLQSLGATIQILSTPRLFIVRLMLTEI
jgi:hypothetical protein